MCVCCILYTFSSDFPRGLCPWWTVSFYSLKKNECSKVHLGTPLIPILLSSNLRTCNRVYIHDWEDRSRKSSSLQPILSDKAVKPRSEQQSELQLTSSLTPPDINSQTFHSETLQKPPISNLIYPEINLSSSCPNLHLLLFCFIVITTAPIYWTLAMWQAWY